MAPRWPSQPPFLAHIVAALPSSGPFQRRRHVARPDAPGLRKSRPLRRARGGVAEKGGIQMVLVPSALEPDGRALRHIRVARGAVRGRGLVRLLASGVSAADVIDVVRAGALPTSARRYAADLLPLDRGGHRAGRHVNVRR